jgi:hypothetical protein
MQEVRGSNPLSSTVIYVYLFDGEVSVFWHLGSWQDSA